MWSLEFKHPYVLLLLVPWAGMIFWYLYRQVYRRGAAIAVSSEVVLKQRETLRVRTYRFVPVLRFLALLFLIIALSRPGRGIHYSSVKNLGIDIMVVLDVSGSMSGEDFQPKNRLTVAKTVLKDFITRRTSDRIGMVIFGSEAYLQCPLTVEHDILNDLVDEIDFGSIDHTRTAMGDAIMLACSRMMDSKAKSKMILLLTDGSNNSGAVEPETAADTCAEMGIKIYSVGIGQKFREVRGPFGFTRTVETDLDLETLQKLSEITGGKFYNATSSGVLWENIKDIDMLEKSRVDLNIYHEFNDKFEILLILAVSLFFFEVLIRSVYYRKVP